MAELQQLRRQHECMTSRDVAAVRPCNVSMKLACCVVLSVVSAHVTADQVIAKLRLWSAAPPDLTCCCCRS